MNKKLKKLIKKKSKNMAFSKSRLKKAFDNANMALYGLFKDNAIKDINIICDNACMILCVCFIVCNIAYTWKVEI